MIERKVVLPAHVWVQDTPIGPVFCNECLLRRDSPLSYGPCDRLLARRLGSEKQD